METIPIENKLIHKRSKTLICFALYSTFLNQTVNIKHSVLRWLLERLTCLPFLLYTEVLEHLGSCYWNQFFSYEPTKIFLNTGQHAPYLAITNKQIKTSILAEATIFHPQIIWFVHEIMSKQGALSCEVPWRKMPLPCICLVLFNSVRFLFFFF